MRRPELSNNEFGALEEEEEEEEEENKEEDELYRSLSEQEQEVLHDLREDECQNTGCLVATGVSNVSANTGIRDLRFSQLRCLTVTSCGM